jgi:hypothetical protein
MKTFKSLMSEGTKAEYKKFFDKKLAKFKVSSPAELSDEEKKKFFDEIDKEWKGEDEKAEGLVKEFIKKDGARRRCAGGDGRRSKNEEDDEEEIDEAGFGKHQDKVDKKAVMKKYKENEDNNAHTENFMMLAKFFGTEDEVKKVKEIMKRNQKQGSTSQADNAWMMKNINPYYKKLK